MREVFLHIGHGKTGSSYIQSLLNLSKKSLEKNGLVYPLEEKDLLDPEKISSGNGRLIYDVSSIDSEIFNDATRSMVFSDEHFFRIFCNDNQYVLDIKKLFMSYGFSKVNILLFTRNPVAHAASLYQQSIKRDGKFHSIDQVFSSYDTPLKVLNLVEKLSADSFFNLTVCNYSKSKDRLTNELADWLELNVDDFVLPKNKVINRSLTYSELYFQSLFNKHMGKSSVLISDPLCELLPSVKSEVVLPSIDVQKKMLNRLWPVIAKINDAYPSQSYEDDSLDFNEVPRDDFVFSKHQLDVICESLATRILEQRKMIQSLKSERSE